MKILQGVGWYFPTSVGGTEVYVSALAAALRAKGHDVTVAAPEPGAAAPRSYRHDGIEVVRYPIPARPTRAEARGEITVRGAEHLHRWIVDHRPDVVHLHTFVVGLGIEEARAARRSGARVVVTPHSAALGFVCQRGTLFRFGRDVCDADVRPATCAACALQQRGLRDTPASMLGSIPVAASRIAGAIPGPVGTVLGMRALIARNWQRQRELMSLVDAFVVLTGAAQSAAAHVSHGPIVVNRLGIDAARFTPKPSPAVQPTRVPIRVGYLGRLEAIKGIEDFVRAVRAVPAGVGLVAEIRAIAQTDADRHAAGALARAAAGDERIVFAPEVPSGHVPELLRSFDLLCCPSRVVEGGPTVAIEAHASGTPVVGTRIGGLAELVTDRVNGRLVEPGDWRALSDVLASAATEPAATIDRWRASLPPVRTMAAIAEDYLALYDGPR